MDSKSAILKAISNNKPSLKQLPVIPAFEEHSATIDLFKATAQNSGSQVIELPSVLDLEPELSTLFPSASRIASTIAEITGNVDLSMLDNASELDGVDVAIVKGTFAVAENGAIWVTESNMLHRVLPFITQHLILVVEKKQIYTNMHQAYQRINLRDIGFGVFIAGPSKTADIEQSLVIGAQGARSLIIGIV